MYERERNVVNILVYTLIFISLGATLLSGGLANFKALILFIRY